MIFIFLIISLVLIVFYIIKITSKERILFNMKIKDKFLIFSVFSFVIALILIFYEFNINLNRNVNYYDYSKYFFCSFFISLFLWIFTKKK